MLFSISQIFGLPAHPFLVHVPIVLIPMATITSVFSFFKRFRREILIATATMAVLGAVFLFLGAGAGESLQHDLPRSEAIHEHAEMGEQSQAPTAVFAISAVGAALAIVAVGQGFKFKGRTLSKKLISGLLVLTLASGLVATIVVSQAGHSGAKSVWDSKGKDK